LQRSGRKGQRLVGVFLLGCLLFNYPMIALFNTRATLAGIPALYAYLFGAWMLLIVLAAWIMEKTD
jgi:hypothetical protein